MSEVTDLSKRLSERRGKADYDKRQEVMELAWRQWRSSVVEAMAARVKAVGTEPDDELDLLVMEIEHTNIVRHAIQCCELGIDPAEQEDDA